MEAHVVNCHLGSMDVVHYQRYSLTLLITNCNSYYFISPSLIMTNSCVISLTIAIFQYSLHQNYDALSNDPDPIIILLNHIATLVA